MALVQSLAAAGHAVDAASAAMAAVPAAADEDGEFEAYFGAFWLTLRASELEPSLG